MMRDILKEKHMKKSILIIGFIAVLMLVMSPVMAVTGSPLTLIQKDSGWGNIAEGQTGTFTYDCDGFTFNSVNVAASTPYTLISYAEPYPGTGSKVLGTGASDANGDITISGTDGWESNLVANTYTAGEYAGQTGSKVWLVPTVDFNGVQLVAWNQANYLFEDNLISPSCEPSSGATTEVSGTIERTLSISTDTGAVAFNNFVVGDNEKDNIGAITVTSTFVPTWKVTASTSDGAGYMRIGSPYVSGLQLTNKLQEYNYQAAAWQDANGMTFTGTGTQSMSMSFKQNVLITDAPGAYGTVVTYTVSTP